MRRGPTLHGLEAPRHVATLHRMSRSICGLIVCSMFVLAGLANALLAQVPARTNSGVSVGSVNLIVQDPQEYKRLLRDILGGSVSSRGSLELVKLPGLLITLEKGRAIGPSVGSTLNHVGLWIRDYAGVKAKVIAARLEIAADSYNGSGCASSPGTPACQFTVTFPDGVRIEFTEDKKLATTAASHHIHMQVTEPEAIRAWYVKTFGSTPYLRRGTIIAAMFDAGEVDFNKAVEPQAATKGRAIDHLGLEVQHLEAFCKQLEAQGVKIETAYHPLLGARFKSAFVTDPAGTRIQLTEGPPSAESCDRAR